MTAKPALLQLDRVRRRLGGRPVLREVSFSVARGEVVALLGINGAGKSTTLSIIAGALAPDAGEVLIDGAPTHADPRMLREHIGWVPENVPLWPELTVREALDACARLRNMPAPARRSACAREIERLQLQDVAQRLCGKLSLGLKRRVGLAQALLHEPDLLVLDEPGNGLDPVQAAQLRDLVKQLAPKRGIILSSHVLAEVQAMCQRVLVLHAGTIQLDAPIDGKGDLAARFAAIAARPVDAAA